MNASHVATGTITALLATVLVWATKWPLTPLDLPTASAVAGLTVAIAGGLVKLYQMYRPPRAPAQVVRGPGATPNL